MPLLGIPSLWELIIIFGVIFLLFGGKKLPELGGAIGESIKNFKKGIRDDDAHPPGQGQGTTQQQRLAEQQPAKTVDSQSQNQGQGASSGQPRDPGQTNS